MLVTPDNTTSPPSVLVSVVDADGAPADALPGQAIVVTFAGLNPPGT